MPLRPTRRTATLDARVERLYRAKNSATTPSASPAPLQSATPRTERPAGPRRHPYLSPPPRPRRPTG
ncbi:MAG: hypothetical protein WKG07_13565 [Hymenobacter sp.]